MSAVSGLPYIIETALLLLVAFLVGCALGYGLRRLAPARQRERRGAPSTTPDPPVTGAPTTSEPVPSGPPVEKQAAALVEPDAAPGKRSRPPADPRPAALAAPRGGIKDDLKQIKGVGPRIEASLNQLGIFHFGQIARWSKKNVAWVDQHLAFKGRIDRENWIEQAKALSGKPASPAVRKRDRSGI
jgi:predicted flap endonuclease-1-like 5' DNA nuclease